MRDTCPCCGSVKVRKINKSSAECENEACQYYKVARRALLFRPGTYDPLENGDREILSGGSYHRRAVRYS